MSGLRPVAAFFIVFATIAWAMVAFSITKTATPHTTPYYHSIAPLSPAAPPPAPR